MSEFVFPNTFCTFGPKLRMINKRLGQKYILLERSLHRESKNFTIAEPKELQEKLLWQKSKM